jgi:sulfate permease, SulP family
LLYVSINMVKAGEIKEVLHLKSKFHNFLLLYTAVMVPLSGFLQAVLSAIVLYVLARLIFPKLVQ